MNDFLLCLFKKTNENIYNNSDILNIIEDYLCECNEYIVCYNHCVECTVKYTCMLHSKIEYCLYCWYESHECICDIMERLENRFPLWYED